MATGNYTIILLEEKMKEAEFIKFYKERNEIKSKKEAKEKIDSFWNALFKAVSEEKRVMFKDWGVFEEKDVKSRKIVIPRQLHADFVSTLYTYQGYIFRQPGYWDAWH